MAGDDGRWALSQYVPVPTARPPCPAAGAHRQDQVSHLREGRSKCAVMNNVNDQ